MKRLLLIPIIAITSSNLNAYTQSERVMDMQKMAQAMQDIQTGFFYNNLDIVKDGTKTLKETIQKVGPIDSEIKTKDIYEKWMNNNLKMTNKIKKKILNKATDIEERFESGDPVQALQAYTKISQQCMKCHVQLRKW